MPATYDKIATTTLGSAGTISFTSIASTWTDLRIVLVCQGSTANDTNMRFNNDGSTIYSQTRIGGNGSTGSSARFNSIGYVAIGNMTALPTSPQWGLLTIDIFSYAGSTNKSALSTFAQDKNGSGAIEYTSSLWSSTAAITRVDLFPASSGTFAIGTTATIYGILKA